MSRFSYAVCLSLAITGAAPSLPSFTFAAPQEPPAGQTAGSMQAYVEAIPGTDTKFEMVPIPAGEFLMGSPETEAKRGKDEGPQHPVKISAFWMGSKEVTWDEFEHFAFSLDLKKKKRENVDPAKQSEWEKKADAVTRPTSPYADETFGFGRSGQPVICVTHHAAMEYTRWLSAKTGKIYRLPTEAEWEYACRAGTTTAYFWGDEPDKIDEFSWYVNNAEKPQPVGKKKPSPWGLFDIHGNVAEWCLDHYVADAYKQFSTDTPTVGPVILPDAKEYPYVARGGSWDDDAPLLCARRPAAARISSGACKILSGPRASGGTPMRPSSVFASSGHSASKKTSRA